MTERGPLIDAFLARAGWADAVRQPLAGDASSRRYERLRRDGESAVLMDAGPDGGGEMGRFVAIARHLDSIGLSAPEILAEDAGIGALLLEDFGDAVFARIVAAEPQCEPHLYEAAVDVLIHLRSAPLPAGLRAFGAAEMAEFVRPAFEWYAPRAAEATDEIVDEFTRQLSRFDGERRILALRDYHSENLIWLPERAGLCRVGLLDFQDAFLSHPAYDLASLLGDARRDVDPALRSISIERYLAATGAGPDNLRLAVSLFGAQRNLRILGVFARLSHLVGKPHYIDMVPRVWRNLLYDLDHPGLVALRDPLLSRLPEPTPDFLAGLKGTCATSPNR